MRSRRSFYILLGVTLLMMVAAFWSQRPLDDAAPVAGRQFPDLGGRVDEVRAVEIETAQGRLRLERTGDGWVARSKDGYPADAGRVRQLVLGISRLERLEKKTADPERFGVLELTGIDHEGSKAVKVTLLADDGAGLAAVLVGKTSDFQSSGRSRYFIRAADDNQSWLVEGSLPPVPEDFTNYLQTALLPGVERSDIRSLRLEHADGETVEIVNERVDGDGGFRLAGLEAGEADADQRSIDAAAGTLQRLALKDVRPAGGGTAGEPVVTVEAVTFDGVRIEARFTRLDPDYGARLTASYEPGLDRGEGGDGSDEEQLARSLNQRWGDRLFVVSQYALDGLMVRRSDIIESKGAAAVE